MEIAITGPRTGRRQRPELAVAGWREWVSLPSLGIDRIKAKLDTGARTSSLHAYDMRTFDRDGRTMVRFKVHPIQRDTATVVAVEAPVKERRIVRSSSGHEEQRIVIASGIELMDVAWSIEITLTRRDAMGFRMLLGRQALKKRFVVDSGRSFVAGRS